jgi:hypothetical protein
LVDYDVGSLIWDCLVDVLPTEYAVPKTDEIRKYWRKLYIEEL